jgi:hypothetical protein
MGLGRMESMRYRTKPFEIEAIKYTGDNILEVHKLTTPENFYEVDPEDRIDDPECIAAVYDKLHSTWVGVKRNQWIIKGMKGEFYPCDDEVFTTKYEAIDG